MPSDFVRSYIESALWSSTDGEGVPLDDSKYADAELSHTIFGSPATITAPDSGTATIQSP